METKPPVPRAILVVIQVPSVDDVAHTGGQITGPIHSIHPNAMPMVLTTREEIDVWINAPAADVLKLQRPFANNTLKIGARGTKRTEAASRADVHSRCDYATT